MDSQHYNIAQRGFTAWNQSRYSSDFEPDFSDGNLKNFNFSMFSLGYMNFRNHNEASKAKFPPSISPANFTGADLRGADFTYAHLAHVCFDGADLRGAKLSTAMMLTKEQLEKAIGDDSTKLPPGMDFPISWRSSRISGPKELFSQQIDGGWKFRLDKAALSISSPTLKEARLVEQSLARLRIRHRALSEAFLGANRRIEVRISQEAKLLDDILNASDEVVFENIYSLWESSLALASILENIRYSRKDLMHPEHDLDEDRLGVLRNYVTASAMFVRLFPEVAGLDSSTFEFNRTGFNKDLLVSILSSAVAFKILPDSDGSLVIALAELSSLGGVHAAKAIAVSEAGKRNLLSICAGYAKWAVIGAAAGIGAGIGGDIGADVSNEFKFGEKAAEWLRVANNEIGDFLDGLPADIREAIEDAVADRKKEQGD